MNTLSDIFPASPDGSAGDLEPIRLNETPSLLVLFTESIERVDTHYLNYPDLMGEVRCLAGPGRRCVLCDISVPRISRAILPAYDLVAAEVRALLISGSSHPHALGPKIAAELRRGGLAERILAVTRVRTKFEVRSLAARPGQDMGEARIKAFHEDLEAGRVALANVIPSRGNAELLDVPEVERAAAALGLARSDYAEADAAAGRRR